MENQTIQIRTDVCWFCVSDILICPSIKESMRCSSYLVHGYSYKSDEAEVRDVTKIYVAETEIPLLDSWQRAHKS